MINEKLKQALIAVAIGAVINVITFLAQYAIEWLRTIPAEVPGTIVGMTTYLKFIRRV